MDDIRIALGQVRCIVGDYEHNFARHAEFTRDAAAAGAKIVCFPETSLSGYPTVDQAPSTVARPLDDPMIDELRELANRHNICILAGLMEDAGSGEILNTQLVVAPGAPMRKYSKIHVPTVDPAASSAGGDLPVFSHGGVTFGVQICFDNHFPESARVLTLRGAELVFSPYASPGPCTETGMRGKRERWLRYLSARALDNSNFVAAVNQIGTSRPDGEARPAVPDVSSPHDTHDGLMEFPGGSMVLNPWADVIAEAPPRVEHLLVVDLPAATLREKRENKLQYFQNWRRPDLYGDLIDAR